MKKKPFFSIVIPTYNRVSDLHFALHAIFRQNFTDYEIVISDNCSTDGTEEMVKKMNNKKIRYVKNRKNIGMIPNQKKAIKHARGTYIFLHSDDDYLLYTDSLQKVYREIAKYRPGYIRVNYVSMSTDKKHLFMYTLNKRFKRNQYLSRMLKNETILSFIIKSDPYFITGITFKNSLPDNVQIINTDPVPWIDVLFYAAKKHGACFIVEPHLIANWSRANVRENREHHFFRLVNGKLGSERFFNAVKKKIDKKTYKIFLHDQLIGHYIRFLPVIKMHIGNKKMLQIIDRIKELDPNMQTYIVYWIYLSIAVFLPAFVLRIAKEIVLYFYIITSTIPDDKQITAAIQKIEHNYHEAI